MLKYSNKTVSSQAQFDFVSIILSIIGLIFEIAQKHIIGSFQSIIGSNSFLFYSFLHYCIGDNLQMQINVMS